MRSPTIPHTLYFTFEQVIGRGSFSVVFIGELKKSGEKVAIKTVTAEESHYQLSYEARVYQDLAANGGTGMIPAIHWHGSLGNTYVMVMDLLGPSLQDVFVGAGRSFSQDMVSRVGREVLSSIEFLHSRRFLHRAIQPEHFVFKDGSFGKLTLIDLGFAKKFMDKTGNHIAMQSDKKLLGDPVFASLNAHYGLQQGRRDDIESVAYVLLYLSTGLLPWDGVEIEEMKESKGTSDVENFFPSQIRPVFQHCRELAFKDAPDYKRLRKSLLIDPATAMAESAKAKAGPAQILNNMEDMRN